MKNLFSVLFSILFFNISAFSQAVNVEIAIHDRLIQKVEGIVCQSDASYVLHRTDQILNTYVLKIDTLGNQLWKKPASPGINTNDGGYSPESESYYVNIRPSADDGLYLVGYATDGCDVFLGATRYVEKLDKDGNSIWSKEWYDYYSGFEYRSGNEINGAFYTSVDWKDSLNSSIFKNFIYELDAATGTVLDSLEIPMNLLLEKIYPSDFYKYIGYDSTDLYAFQNDNAIEKTVTFQSNIKGMQVSNDTIFLLTQDSLFALNSELNLFYKSAVNGDFSHFKLDGNSISYAKYDQGNGITLYKTDKNFTLTSSSFVSYTGNLKKFDYNTNRLSLVADYPLAINESTAIRYVDFYLDSQNDNPINHTDAELLDIDVYNVVLEQKYNMWHYEIFAKALVKNSGNTVMTEVQLNHYLGYNYGCFDGGFFFTKRAENIELYPGDTMWIDLENFSSDSWGGITADSLFYDFCVFTSIPNGVIDFNIDNDMVCQKTFLGTTTGLEEQILNKNKKIVKIIDLMGREIPKIPNTLMIYIYEEGASEKVFIKE